MVNGYLKMPIPDSDEVAKTAVSALQEHLHLLRLLVMRDVPATGLAPSKTAFSEQSHRVNLAFWLQISDEISLASHFAAINSII